MAANGKADLLLRCNPGAGVAAYALQCLTLAWRVGDTARMSQVILISPARFAEFNRGLFGPSVLVFSWERLARADATDFLITHAPDAHVVLCDHVPNANSAGYKRLIRYVREGSRTVKVLTAFDKRDVAGTFQEDPF